MTAYNKNRRQETADFINKIKSNTPCSDCHLFYPPAVMEYDHRPEEKKFKAVSKMVQWGYGIKLILKEIAKCDLVCANCHRLRTVKRLSSDRDQANASQ